MFSYMRPTSVHFVPPKRVLEPPIGNPFPCSLAVGLEASFWVVLVSPGGSIWTSFGVFLDVPRRRNSIFFYSRQPSLVFGLSGGLQAWIWRPFGCLFGVLDRLFGFFERAILCAKPCCGYAPLACRPWLYAVNSWTLIAPWSVNHVTSLARSFVRMFARSLVHRT